MPLRLLSRDQPGVRGIRRNRFWTAWNCSRCGLTGISGIHRQCTNCSDPKSVTDPKEQEYIPEHPEEITDPQQLATTGTGGDWNCPRCGLANPDENKICSCGTSPNRDTVVAGTTSYVGPKTGDTTPLSPAGLRGITDHDLALEDLDPYKKAVEVITTDDVPRRNPDIVRSVDDLPMGGPSVPEPYLPDDESSYGSAVDQDEPLVRRPPSIYRPLEVSSNRGAVISFALVTAVVFVGLFGIYLLQTKPGTVTITSLRWELSIDIERYSTVSKSGWNIPAGGRETNRYQAISGYVDVYVRTDQVQRSETITELVGTRTVYDYCTETVFNGDGTYDQVSAQCPRTENVYDTYTRYYTEDVDIYEPQPVWDTKYDYDIDEWVWYATHANQGSNKQPIDPNVPALTKGNNPNVTEVGDQRAKPAVTKLYAEYKDQKGSLHEDQLTEPQWRNLEIDQTIPARYRIGDRLAKVEWPIAA